MPLESKKDLSSSSVKPPEIVVAERFIFSFFRMCLPACIERKDMFVEQWVENAFVKSVPFFARVSMVGEVFLEYP